jgi:hypothetical protein
MNWNAGSMIADGTNCAAPVIVTIPSGGGVRQYAVICDDGGSFQGSTHMPDGWDVVGDISFTLTASSPGGTEELAGDFYFQCKGDDAAIDDTWDGPHEADLTLTTGDDNYNVTIGSIDADTECDPGDNLWWEYIIDDANHDANAANILNVKLEYSRYEDD